MKKKRLFTKIITCTASVCMAAAIQATPNVMAEELAGETLETEITLVAEAESESMEETELSAETDVDYYYTGFEGEDNNIQWIIYKNGLLKVTGYGDAGYSPVWTEENYAPLITSAEVTVTDPTRFSSYFNGCKNLVSIDLTGVDFMNVTDISSMFSGCSSLKTIKFTTYQIGQYEQGKLDTSNVENMSNLFYGCSALAEINAGMFMTDSVTNMSDMFSGCTALTELDLSNWNTEHVTSVSGMLDGCKNLKTVNMSGWDTRNIYDYGYLFSGCRSLEALDVSMFVTTGYEEYYRSLYDEEGNETDDAERYQYANMSGMFNGCESLRHLNISNFDTRYVNDMKNMFANCPLLESISFPAQFDVSNVVDASAMFSGDAALKSIALERFTRFGHAWQWNWSGSDKMVDQTILDNMFSGCKSLTAIDMSKLDTSHIKSMRGMFSDCGSLISLDLSSVSMDQVEDISNLVSGCSKLQTVNTTGWQTGNLRRANFAFSGCSSLKTIAISDWNTESLESVSEMFFGCTGLTRMDFSNNDLRALTDADDMFSGCENMTVLVLPANMQVSITLPQKYDGNDYTWQTNANAVVTNTLKNQSAAVTYTRKVKPSTVNPDDQKEADDKAADNKGGAGTLKAEKGDVIEPSSGKNKYKITSVDKSNPTVAFVGKTGSAVKVTIPQYVSYNGVHYKVVSVQANAFKNDKKLKEVSIASGITEIGSNAFSGCKNLKKVTIGKNVKTIGTKAFYNCGKLAKIVVKGSSLKKIGKNALKGIHKNCVIDVPNKKISTYKKLLKGKGQKSSVKIK